MVDDKESLRLTLKINLKQPQRLLRNDGIDSTQTNLIFKTLVSLLYQMIQSCLVPCLLLWRAHWRQFGDSWCFATPRHLLTSS